MRDAALLLLGHGSTLNADSSAPTYQHAEEIRRRGEFAEVHVGFWKEEPNFRQALRQTSLRRVYVLPNFISSGYFTEQIIPRELGLTGPVTQIGEQDVFYCKPVGLSPAMTEVLLKRAHEVVASSSEPSDPKQTCLFICGHGTSLNDNSTKIIHEQAEIIRAKGIFADCQGVLMEQRPFVKDWRTLTACRDVIVVPFFISDGLHSYEDIPVLLGLTHNMREQGFTNPHREGERRLWYASAIGTEPAIADVIIAQTRGISSDQDISPASIELSPELNELVEFVRTQAFSVPFKPTLLGEVVVRASRDGSFGLGHENDLWCETKEITSAEALRLLVFATWNGTFRPLRAAANLRDGWHINAANPAAFSSALDYIYPAAVANWSLWKNGKLPVTAWSETAERQTGRFRVVRELGDEGIRELAAEVCDRCCLKQRLWGPCAQEVAPAKDEIPLLCPEACNYLVSKAREKLKGPEAEAE